MQELYIYDARGTVARNVMSFIKKDHQKPSKYYQEEILLFLFIHHNKKLYNAGSLKPD